MDNTIIKKYENMSEASKAAIWFTVCNCISSGITFLSMPLFTRLMSSSQYGVVTVYNSWVQLFSVFATLNLAAGAFNNGMVKFSGDRDKYSSSMQGLFSVVNIIVGSFVLGACFLNPNLIDLPLPFIFCIFIQIYANQIFALWSARQRYEYKYRSLLAMTFIFAVAVTVFSVLVVYAFPYESMKASAKVFSSAVGGLIVAIGLIISTQRKCLKPVVFKYWRFAFNFSVPLIPHYLSLIVLGQIDRIMIASMIGERTAAHYAVAYTIGMALSIISSALNSSIVPWQFEKIKQRNLAGLAQRVTITISFLSVIGIALALVSPEILLVAAPPEYQEAVIVMPPVVLSVVFTFIYNILSNYEFYYMENKFISFASMIAAVVNIALNLLLIPLFGFIAAAYSTVICYALLAFAHTVFSWRVCCKHVGRNSAKKMFNPRVVWCLAGTVTVVMLACYLLYPFVVVRYALFVFAALFCYLRRDLLLGKLSA